jgi:hypothetical protein
MSTYDDLRHWERALLGGLLLAKPARQLAIVPTLEPEMFSTPVHKAMVTAMRRIVADGVVVDAYTVGLRVVKDAPEVFRPDMIAELHTDGVMMQGSNLEWYRDQLLAVRGRQRALEYTEGLRTAIEEEEPAGLIQDLLDGIAEGTLGGTNGSRNGR